MLIRERAGHVVYYSLWVNKSYILSAELQRVLSFNKLPASASGGTCRLVGDLNSLQARKGKCSLLVHGV